MLQLEPRGAARQLVLGAAKGRRPRNSSLNMGKRVLIGIAFLANLVTSETGIFCRTRRLPSARIGFLRTSSKNPRIYVVYTCVCVPFPPRSSKRKPLTTPSFLPLLREVALPLWTRQRSNDGPTPPLPLFPLGCGGGGGGGKYDQTSNITADMVWDLTRDPVWHIAIAEKGIFVSVLFEGKRNLCRLWSFGESPFPLM